MNFRNYSDNPIWDATMGAGKSQGNVNVPLVRQSSIYSLTFDELQNTIGGIGKDFGSMNMDELLKNVWTAEETQAFASNSAGGGGGGGGGEAHNQGGYLQRQGSLTLPRTLSQKTVDEVWRDLIKESTGGAKDGGGGNGGSSMPQRQPTLGEMTLEEFLVRAGVVREDMPQQQIGRPNGNNGWFGDFSKSNTNNSGPLILGYQQPNGINGNLVEGNSLAPKHLPQRQAPQQQPPPPLFPKPANVAFAAPMHVLNNAQLASPNRRRGMIGAPEHSMNGTLIPSSAVVTSVGMLGLATAQGSSPGSISPDVITKSNVDTSPPVPCVINRGRKSGAVEKVVERRQRRMIKNRESAARSRARKQAYTYELESEVAKLKEMNRELQRKQEEFMEMQKNKDLDSGSGYKPWANGKRQCLRRTLTGPW